MFIFSTVDNINMSEIIVTICWRLNSNMISTLSCSEILSSFVDKLKGIVEFMSGAIMKARYEVVLYSEQPNSFNHCLITIYV